MSYSAHTASALPGARRWSVECALVIGTLALAGCDGGLTGYDCTDELRTELQPRGEQQIAVGTSFAASIALSTCGGRDRLSDAFTWSARDTLVVRVDPLTGRVTGRSPGSTMVDVRGTRYGAVGTIPVIVR